MGYKKYPCSRCKKSFHELIVGYFDLGSDFFRISVCDGCYWKIAAFCLNEKICAHNNKPDKCEDCKKSRKCSRKRSDMTPCVVTDGDCAKDDNGRCVGCGK